MAMADPLDRPVGRCDVEGAGATDGNAPEVGARLLPSGHDCLHDVACLEALDALSVLRACARKTKAVHATQLS